LGLKPVFFLFFDVMESAFNVHPDIPLASTINKDVYNSPQVFETCREQVFAAGWQFIGDASLVDKPESVYPFTLLPGYLDEPLLLSRDKEGCIHLLSNVCTHRGALLATKACHAARLRCPYHGRVFNLDGRFVSMPEFKEVQNFPTEGDNLPSLPLFRWGNLLFTSLNKSHDPQIFFKDMIERVSWMPLEDFVFRPELTKEFSVHASWALYCENYLEGFHIPFVHSGLNAVLDFGEYATELFFPYSSLQIGMARKKEDAFDMPPESPDYGKHIAAYYFWVFPNMMFNFYPWGLSVNIVIPVAPTECRVQFLSYVWKEELLEKGAGSGLDRVEQEDEEIVESVQRGVRSRFDTHGRYSVTREQGTHHFHRILAAFLGQGSLEL
jgi:choline monooxygenase